MMITRNSVSMNSQGPSPTVQARPPLDDIAKRVRGLLASGMRAVALDESRRAVMWYPRSALSHRELSYSLTYAHVYRNDESLSRQLIVDGVLGEALACSRVAMRCADANYEDFLQAGYCLTFIGQLEEAAALIRVATDMKCEAEYPAVYAGLNDSWKPLAPRFLIIGAAKAGTTSLYRHLCQHPLVLPAVTKEVSFFSVKPRGRDWYLAHFPSRPEWEGRFCTGEANVATFNHPIAPSRVRETEPDIKLVALVRNPVDRAISHYYNDLNVGMETRPIGDAMEEELSYLDCSYDLLAHNLVEYRKSERRYLELGLYAFHLENWLRHFPPEQLVA